MPGLRSLNAADAGRWGGGAPNARSVAFERLGSPQGIMAALYPYMYQDTKFAIDDFEGAELDPGWEYDGDTGTFPWSVADSYATASTGAVATNATTLFGPETLRPSKNCGAEFRFQLNVITGFQLECGLVNLLGGDTRSPIISDIDTPAAVSNNTGAVFHIDTGETLATGAFVVSANAGATVSKTAVGTFTPTADNWYTLRVQTVFNDSSGYYAFFYLFDTNSSRMTLVSSGNTSIAAATAATTAYRPWFLIRTLNTTEKIAKIDYVAKWSDR